MYWCDARTDLIEKSNLDGTSRVTILNEASIDSHFYGLTLRNDILYFTDRESRYKMKISNVSVL